VPGQRRSCDWSFASREAFSVTNTKPLDAKSLLWQSKERGKCWHWCCHRRGLFRWGQKIVRDHVIVIRRLFWRRRGKRDLGRKVGRLMRQRRDVHYVTAGRRGDDGRSSRALSHDRRGYEVAFHKSALLHLASTTLPLRLALALTTIEAMLRYREGRLK